MKKYLNKKSTLICLCIVAILAIISIALLYIKPKNNENAKDYNKNTAIFTMDDKTMTLDEVYFIAKNRQAYYEEYFYTYGTSFSWDIPVEQGKTYEDLILEESLDYAKQIFILSEYATANGITLSETEQKVIASTVSSYMTNTNSKLLKACNASEDLVTRVYTKTTLHDKVCEQILADKDLTIDPEDARNCLVGIVEISPEYFDSPERIAEKILERVNSGEVIGGVASVYDATVDKINVYKNSDIKDEMEEFCLSLKDDECKMIILDGIYYVVYCYLEDDETVTADAKEILIDEKRTSYINEFIESIVNEDSITVNNEAWSKINFDETVYTKNDIIQSK